VISIGKLRNADYYEREVVDGAEDYYVGSGEAPGRWVGTLAAELGLDGNVDGDQLRALFELRHPFTDEALLSTRATKPGFDVTISAPKSVSVLWALGDAETSATVVDSLWLAVDDTRRYLEANACSVRRGHAGVDVEDGAGFVGAAFLHRTSRLADPGLHVHLLVINATHDADGRWTALDGRAVYRERYTADAVFQASLRHALARDCGYLFAEPDRHGVAEIAGVPAGVRRAFSQRRIVIEAEMARHGVTTAEGARIATLDTRPPKGEAIEEDELRRRWARRARQLEFSIDDVPTMRRDPRVVLTPADIARRVTESDAYFTRGDIVRSVATGATQGATLDQIEAKVDEYLSSANAVELVEGRIWTTPEILELERSTVAAAVAGRGGRMAVVDAGTVEAAVAARPSLSDEQREMIRSLTQSGDAVQLVVGRAGAGKTFALDAVRAAFEASGHRVLGTSLAARAARELEDGSGIRSQTAASLRTAIDSGTLQLDSCTVLVVDEAGMVGTRMLAGLVADSTRAGAKVIAVGDPKQLPEIQAGGLFAALAGRLGHQDLVDNRRQVDPAERTALVDLREGRVGAALGRLVANGNVTLADNAELLRDGMVSDWLRAESSGAHVVMVALRRDDVDDLNDRARQSLMRAGRLGSEVLSVDDVGFAVGDRVLAHRNRYDLGLLNGDTGRVAGVRERHLVVDLDSGRQVEVPKDYLESGHLGHGYARTVHKAQGMTCDEALLLGSESLFVEAGYTGLSRGRAHNHLYAVASSNELGPDGADDPLAHVRRTLQVSHAKTAAMDLVAQVGP
jgi:conjugative relaxase-like TrwC/TraI family protein